MIPWRIVPNTYIKKSPCSISTWFISIHFHKIKETTKNLANSTMKKKNSVPNVDFFELVLLSHSIAAKQTMLVSNQVCAALAQCRNLSCSNEATNYFDNGNILVRSIGGCDLRSQDHPIVDKHQRLDHFQSFDCGMFHLVWIYHGHPGRTPLVTSSVGWLCSIPYLPASFHIDVREVVLNSHNSTFPTSWIMCFDSGLKD